MADVAIVSRTTESAPKSYTLTQGQELAVKAVRAVVDGSSATQGFLPALQLVAPDGTVMWTAVPLSQIAAAGSADCSWFPDVEEGVLTTGAPVGVTDEIVYYDTVNAGTPLTMSTVLQTGVSYVLVVEGSYSLWNLALDVGTPDANAQFPGSTVGRVSTQVGLDADTLFAHPSSHPQTIGHASGFQLSLDGGVTFAHIEPVGGPYTTPQAGHLYRYQLTGQGHALRVQVVDINPPDNYGKLRLTLQVPSGTGTGSGAGSLVPPADTTNNGQGLVVLSGVPTFSAIDGGSP